MAVLPTPGSPIKQGLFFERLFKICTTLSISVSLPITASSSFFFALLVRLVPYISKKLFFFSFGFFSVFTFFELFV